MGCTVPALIMTGGVYAAPTRSFWHLDKPPTHLDGPTAEQFSWEVERFCTLALQANPTVLEVLWSPLVEQVTDDGRHLQAIRPAFLSRRVADTYGRYAQDQLDRVAARRQRTGHTNHEQAVHMIRLLHAGTHVLRTGDILVDATPLRDRLLAVRQGEVPWERIAAWAADLLADLKPQTRWGPPMHKEPGYFLFALLTHLHPIATASTKTR